MEKQIIKINNKIFSGSGIIFIENFNNRHGRNELSILLFRNNKTYKYSDLGGVWIKKILIQITHY